MNKHLIDLLNLGCQITFDKSSRPGNYILVKIIFKEKDKSHTTESTISVNDLHDVSLANLFFIETKNKFLEKLYS